MRDFRDWEYQERERGALRTNHEERIALAFRTFDDRVQRISDDQGFQAAVMIFGKVGTAGLSVVLKITVYDDRDMLLGMELPLAILRAAHNGENEVYIRTGPEYEVSNNFEQDVTVEGVYLRLIVSGEFGIIRRIPKDDIVRYSGFAELKLPPIGSLYGSKGE